MSNFPIGCHDNAVVLRSTNYQIVLRQAVHARDLAEMSELIKLIDNFAVLE